MIFRTGSEIGRMMVDKEGFKYIRYDAAGIEEQLLNLKELASPPNQIGTIEFPINLLGDTGFLFGSFG